MMVVTILSPPHPPAAAKIDHRPPARPDDDPHRDSYGDAVYLSRPPRSPSSSHPLATHENCHRSNERRRRAPKDPKAKISPRRPVVAVDERHAPPRSPDLRARGRPFFPNPPRTTLTSLHQRSFAAPARAASTPSRQLVWRDPFGGRLRILLLGALGEPLTMKTHATLTSFFAGHMF